MSLSLSGLEPSYLPLLSFIIPMYNCRAYIAACIDSITSQGVSEALYEIIVIDDGSADSGSEVVEGLQAVHPNISLLRQANAGQSVARNRGLDVAKGEFLFFVDGDDELVAGTLPQIMLTLRELPQEVEILSFDTSAERACTDFRIQATRSGAAIYTAYPCNNGAWGAIFRRSFLQQSGIRFVEGRLSEDAMFTVECMLAARKVSRVPAIVYRYVRHPGSTTTSRKSAHMRRYISDFRFVIGYLTSLIEAHSPGLLPAERRRFEQSRDTFILFLYIRMVRARLYEEEITEVTASLKAQGLYPFKCPISSLQYRCLHFIINHLPLFRLAAKAYRCIKRS